MDVASVLILISILFVSKETLQDSLISLKYLKLYNLQWKNNIEFKK